jgi:rhodanese-related sulfurtransferase
MATSFSGRGYIFIIWKYEFIAAVKRFGCQLDTQIILICRSGYRSTDAGHCLINQAPM